MKRNPVVTTQNLVVTTQNSVVTTQNLVVTTQNLVVTTQNRVVTTQNLVVTTGFKFISNFLVNTSSQTLCASASLREAKLSPDFSEIEDNTVEASSRCVYLTPTHE